MKSGTIFVFFIIFPISALILTFFFPRHNDIFRELGFWICLLIVIIGDDILQYWYHRMAHTWSWLWKLHRPHHAAREMGILVLLDHPHRSLILKNLFTPANFFGWMKQKKEKEKKSVKKLKSNKLYLILITKHGSMYVLCMLYVLLFLES